MGANQPERCRECLRDLKTISPRNVVQIGPTSTLPPGKPFWKVAGKYCSSDCALNAIERGWNQTYTKKP